MFDPHDGREYDRDEDHLAMMMELVGPMPKHLVAHGLYSRELFTRRGELHHIRKLHYFPLGQVLRDKYRFSSSESEEITAFLVPMLRLDPRKRATARDCLSSEFLQSS